MLDPTESSERDMVDSPSTTAELDSSTVSSTPIHHADVDMGGVDNSIRRKSRRSPALKPLRVGFRDFSNICTVIVGDPGKEYLVHRELLTSASPFFAGALNSSFAESIDQVVRLPEQKPETFEWFLQWLYTGTLKTASTGCSTKQPHNLRHGVLTGYLLQYNSSNTGSAASHDPVKLFDSGAHIDGDLCNSAGSPKYFLLFELYALADQLLTTQLSNEVIGTIARLSESTNSVPTPSDTWLLYGSADDGSGGRSGSAINPNIGLDGICGSARKDSPLRNLVLDLFAYKKTDRLLDTHRDAWHPRFLRDLCVKLKRPGPEVVVRHLGLQHWKPVSWNCTKSCEICCILLQPQAPAYRCSDCEKAFCCSCLRAVVAGKVALPLDPSGCKPWAGRGLCFRYHEHSDDEEMDACG